MRDGSILSSTFLSLFLYLFYQVPDNVESERTLIPLVQQKLVKGHGPIPEGFTIKPDLNEIKAKLATYQALQVLHASGVLIAVGPLISGGQHGFTVENIRGTVSSPRVWIPAIYAFYGLATAFQGKTFRLASGDVYLSSLDESLLSSRAKRCLQEAIDAFRHGLYLSACMNAGAGSESMWMELGRLVHQKVMATKELSNALAKSAVIAKVIDATWKALNDHAKATLNSIIPFDIDQRLFKEQADRWRDRRNYAMHADAADVDEPLFTYNETGILLLDAADYFNKLAKLIAAFP